MAEFAVTDGMPPPSHLPDGECICSVVDGVLRIARADPRILISAELLDILEDRGGWHADLDTTGCKPGHGYVGAVLKIDGVNQQVVYRIVDMVPRINGYIGEWPD